MSYEKCRNITIKNNSIFIESASNNVIPLYWTKWEYMEEEKDMTIQDKLDFLFYDMWCGNIQISCINNKTLDFAYANYQIRPIINVFERNQDMDLYDTVKKFYMQYKKDKMEELQVTEEQYNEQYNDKYWHILKLKAIREVFGAYLKSWQMFVSQKDDKLYKLQYCNSYIKKVGAYRDRSYSYSRMYITNDFDRAKAMNYKQAYLIREDLKNYNLQIVNA